MVSWVDNLLEVLHAFARPHRWKGSLRPTSLAVASFRFLRLRDAWRCELWILFACIELRVHRRVFLNVGI